MVKVEVINRQIGDGKRVWRSGENSYERIYLPGPCQAGLVNVKEFQEPPDRYPVGTAYTREVRGWKFACMSSSSATRASLKK